MEMTRPAEAHWATEYRSTGEMEFSGSQHDCSVERATHIFIGFPKEDSQKRTFLWQIPGLGGRGRLSGGGIWGWWGHNGIRRAMRTVSPISDKRRGLTSLHNSQVAKECIDYQGNGALDINANSSATPEPVVSPRCDVTAQTFSFPALLSSFMVKSIVAIRRRKAENRFGVHTVNE